MSIIFGDTLYYIELIHSLWSNNKEIYIKKHNDYDEWDYKLNMNRYLSTYFCQAKKKNNGMIFELPKSKISWITQKFLYLPHKLI